MPVKYFIYGVLILIVLIALIQVASCVPIFWLIGGILFGITCFVGLAMAIGCIIQILVES